MKIISKYLSVNICFRLCTDNVDSFYSVNQNMTTLYYTYYIKVKKLYDEIVLSLLQIFNFTSYITYGWEKTSKDLSIHVFFHNCTDNVDCFQLSQPKYDYTLLHILH